MAGIAEFEHRVAELDGSGQRLADREAVGDDIRRYVQVLETATSTGDHSRAAVVVPADADRVTATCRLLSRLDHAVPQIVSGPVDRHGQYWISTGKPPWVAPREPELAEAGFTAVTGPPGGLVKPFTGGLHTSTGFPGGQGMWRSYLDLRDWDSLFARPWFVWQVSGDAAATILEVSSASAWAGFVQRYPRPYRDLLYPDWAAAGRDYDAVHVTARAIAAIQGFRLQTAAGLLAPVYWDVETTFWLRWRFSSVRLEETAD
ncbi:MAG: hypothetical protein ACRDOE_16735 [Streptosporangiaceae bacterium]